MPLAPRQLVLARTARFERVVQLLVRVFDHAFELRAQE